VRRTANQTDSDVTCAGSCDQGKSRKDRKIIRVDKTKFFSKRNQPTYAFCSLIRFLFFFGKKKFFCYKKEHKSPFGIVYIVSCSIIFARCCWSIHSKVVRLGKDAHSKQKSHSYTISSVIPQVYAHALHIVWYDPISETACMQRRQKN